ncbi:MAG: type II toxin-antitoxin system HicA family toxin [Patescibacteria group bacterium]
MTKLPRLSGNEAVKCFAKLGYRVVRQKGSHLRLRCQLDQQKKPLTIPRHNELGKGLLRKLIRDANLTIDEFLELF